MAKQIKISDELYDRFFSWSFKGKKSFNEVLEAMLDYFVTTRIKPTDVSASPFLDFKKDIERIVRIIKAQEKQYFSKIGMIKDYIETEKKDYLSTHLEEVKSAFVGESLTTEELNVFLGEFENLKKKNERLNTLIESQKKELENKKSESVFSENSESKNLIFWELFENFSSEGRIEGANFIVNRHQLDMYSDRLKELANVR